MSRRSRSRKLLALSGSALAVILSAANALAAPGDITKKTGSGACVSADGSGGSCNLGKIALKHARSTAISPDGKHLYVAFGEGLGIYDINQTTGAITAKGGQAGCIAQGTFGECADGNRTTYLERLAISPDGKTLYGVTGYSGGDLVIFDRNLSTGVLTQSAQCFSWEGYGGCTNMTGYFYGPSDVAVSPDGTSVYVADPFTGMLIVFDRNSNGALTLKSGGSECFHQSGDGGCSIATMGMTPSRIAISPDGASLYLVDQFWGLSVFDRAGGGTLA